jgi:hypothetical protein
MFGLSRKAIASHAGRASTSNDQQDGGDPPADVAMERITDLWKTAYFGLNKYDPKASIHRIDELLALCNGAGASIIDRQKGQKLLGHLETALERGHRGSSAFDSLRVHKNTSQELKEAVAEVLDAYVREVHNVNQLEQLLRVAQLPLREVKDSEWPAKQEELKPLFDSTGKKLIHYHARLHVIQLDIEKEAIVQSLGEEKDGWIILRHIVEPWRGKSRIGSFASSVV